MGTRCLLPRFGVTDPISMQAICQAGNTLIHNRYLCCESTPVRLCCKGGFTASRLPCLPLMVLPIGKLHARQRLVAGSLHTTSPDRKCNITVTNAIQEMWVLRWWCQRPVASVTIVILRIYARGRSRSSLLPRRTRCMCMRARAAYSLTLPASGRVNP